MTDEQIAERLAATESRPVDVASSSTGAPILFVKKKDSMRRQDDERRKNDPRPTQEPC